MEDHPMNPVSKYILLVSACLSVLAVFANCSVMDEAKKNSQTSQATGCFVFADPAAIKPGETSVLKPSPSVNWNDYKSIEVAGQTLTKASINGITVEPANSRSYVAKATGSDGKVTSCDVAVKVEGADFDAACTLLADPATAAAGQSVTVTMQVSGSEQIAESLINNVSVGGAAGGAKTVTINASRTMIGTIKAADGRSTECSVTVEMKHETASGECKVEPSAGDNQALADANAKYDAGNAVAKANKLAEIVASRSDYAGVETKTKAGMASQAGYCAAITGETNPTGCTLVNNQNLAGGVSYGLVNANGQYYEIYAYDEASVTVKIVSDSGNVPAPAIVYKNINNVQELEVEICECTYDSGTNDTSSSGISADMEPPYKTFTWYPVAQELRDDSYKGGTAHPYEHQAAYQKTKTVSPPEGTPKPKCPITWNEAT
jgi:hypothetical protein